MRSSAPLRNRRRPRLNALLDLAVGAKLSKLCGQLFEIIDAAIGEAGGLHERSSCMASRIIAGVIGS